MASQTSGVVVPRPTSWSSVLQSLFTPDEEQTVMADRFPSIEDVETGGTEVRDAGEGNFLDRERALLGDDADLFASGGQPTTTVEDGDDDLLGGDFSSAGQHGAAADDETNGFESSFPAIETQNEHVGPGGSITNTTTPFPGSGSGSTYTNYRAPNTEEDTEPIRQWREKRDADLARRDEASARIKAETEQTARKDIDSFYENYNKKTDKQKAQTAKEAEEFLASREDTTAGGTAWERIAKLTDLSGKGQLGGGEGSTKKRMRELLLSLKGDKDAPGAAGI